MTLEELSQRLGLQSSKDKYMQLPVNRVKRSTDKAVLLVLYDEEDDQAPMEEVWLPYSQMATDQAGNIYCTVWIWDQKMSGDKDTPAPKRQENYDDNLRAAMRHRRALDDMPEFGSW